MRIEFSLDGYRSLGAWMVGAFLVVFLVTRLVTRLIRAGRGPFANTVVGGVHLHHLVYGIFLMLGAGAAEFVYRTQGNWSIVLAVAFGAGAALTLDEFALWLHLSDVYWERQGRLSVDAVMVVAAVGGLLVLGFNPFDHDPNQSAPVLAALAAVNLVFAAVTALKGKVPAAIIGIFLTPLAIATAIRLAKPGSPWARRFYRTGSVREARSRRRYPPGRRSRWDKLADTVGGHRSERH